MRRKCSQHGSEASKIPTAGNSDWKLLTSNFCLFTGKPATCNSNWKLKMCWHIYAQGSYSLSGVFCITTHTNTHNFANTNCHHSLKNGKIIKKSFKLQLYKVFLIESWFDKWSFFSQTALHFLKYILQMLDTQKMLKYTGEIKSNL